MTPRRVGILGGMGPEATVLLMQRILGATPATDDADHVPLIVDQNTQVPSRIRRLIEGRGEDPGPVLVAMARRLEQAGAEALAMPCNTAHHYAHLIRQAVSVPFIDMVELSVARAAERPGPVGILASPAVRRVGLFDTALERFGRTAVYPSDEDALLAAIRALKSSGPSPETRQVLKDASAELLRAGAVVQLIACTEFSLISEETDPRCTAFDTLDELAAAVVAFSRGKTAEPRKDDGNVAPALRKSAGHPTQQGVDP
jgi:aspartate racemase